MFAKWEEEELWWEDVEWLEFAEDKELEDLLLNVNVEEDVGNKEDADISDAVELKE